MKVLPLLAAASCSALSFCPVLRGQTVAAPAPPDGSETINIASHANVVISERILHPRANNEIITISTANSALNLFAGKDGRLYEAGYGSAKAPITLPEKLLNRQEEYYPPSGNGFTSEPALEATHADGNTSTDLVYVKHETKALSDNVSETRIELKDTFYPFFVTLCFKSYRNEDVIEQWTEIHHDEEAPVTLYRFASASPVIHSDTYWLTQFHSIYGKEAQLLEEKLTPGIKMLDSKLGIRTLYQNPMFFLALGSPAQEETGEAIGGTLKWSGSFQFNFELDDHNTLRSLCGVNPFGSQRRLARGEVFSTPGMLWSWTNIGKGQLSRNFHRWAREYGIRDGHQPRPVLLNNWEATGMHFDEARLTSLFDEARGTGIDSFLLDDGWFGNKHPRNKDNAGLGDWQVNISKLPHGLSYLADEAKKRDLGFGIWVEPEMVNPQSDLYEQHPEWAIVPAHREPQTSRNQFVLDLCRPEVREFAWKVVNDTLGQNPGISFIKWDCNRFITQGGSSYLKPEDQSHLIIDYGVALYDVMNRMATQYPKVMAMACAGGGGRVDYGVLRYFHTFWPSDNTDPAARVFIQWGFSQFFPANTIASHVTRSGNRPVKFALDVALSGELGLDEKLAALNPAALKATIAAISLYKNELLDIVQQGDLYRLESPYERPRSVLDYVSADRSQGVLFVFQLKDLGDEAVKPRGLDPQRKYRVREVNLPDGVPSKLAIQGQTIDGATLMRDGLVPPCHSPYESAVIKFEAAQ